MTLTIAFTRFNKKTASGLSRGSYLFVISGLFFYEKAHLYLKLIINGLITKIVEK
jgi:hypothetical protein